MKNILFILLLLLTLVSLASCNKSAPEVQPPPEVDTIKTLSPQKEVIAWIDCNANVYSKYGRFNAAQSINEMLDTMKQVGITGLVVDLKGNTGFTVYNSSFTKQLKKLDGKGLSESFDYTDFILKEAKRRGFKVYASVTTFVEGNSANGIGTIYSDKAFKLKYESIVCDVNGKQVRVTSTGRNGFVNPAQPEVQERMINILKEIVSRYAFDGLILDYCRYTDIDADFSDFSKLEFIKFLEDQYKDMEAKYMSFPKDIVSSWQLKDDRVIPASNGKYFKKWLVYRANVIKSFVEKARLAVKSARSTCNLGVYVGAWYSTYYNVGANWASADYDPFSDGEIRFTEWASPEYRKTGYAESLDVLMTGNYSTQLYLRDNPLTQNLRYHWWSIEGSLAGIKRITKNKVPLYGSLDLGNLNWSSQEAISSSIKYIIGHASQGVMLFDIVHIYEPKVNRLKAPLWEAVKKGLDK